MYADKGQSLVEKKKLQWAREREELAVLNLPWGVKDNAQFLRTRNVIKFQNAKESLRREASSRRRSLPPLCNKNHQPIEKFEKEMGGETSGYGSDNVNNSPIHYQQVAWNHALGYESSSSGRDDRPKWGDRGVHVGKFWEPKELENFGKNNDTPGWVKRGLETDTKLIVSNSSPAESPEQELGDRERPCTSSTTSQIRCFIRGQNAPVDPSELEERERRRQLALAHQEAIRQQLEEREKRRKEERERKIKEEYEEDMRIQREKEIERQRKEEEHKLLREKLEREKKRKEAIQEALELAEKQAKQEKMKQRALKQNNLNMKENIVEKEKVNPMMKLCEENNNFIENESEQIKKISIKNNNNNVNLETNKINANNISNNNYNNIPPLQLPQPNPQPTDLALVLQTPYETFQNMQFAVLMPTVGTGPAAALPIAVPITLATDRSNPSRTENRILTPTQFRNKKFCDISTQTDPIDFPKTELEENNKDKYVREKLANLELNYEIRNRKDRRIRRDEAIRETNNEERPKWGVNRPPTRYLKQSEKDPLYQRRKQRQKLRQVKGYDDKHSAHSSDDSQTASPRAYRKNIYPEKRHNRALWRKNEQLFAQNVRVYQTEIVPLESDKDQIYYKHCCCHCGEDNKKYSAHSKHVEILKIEHGSPIQSKHRLPDRINNNSFDSNDLLMAEEKWENSPRSPSLSRNSEN